MSEERDRRKPETDIGAKDKDDVEAHGFKGDKYAAIDEGDDVEAHGFKGAQDKYAAAIEEGPDVEAHNIRPNIKPNVKP